MVPQTILTYLATLWTVFAILHRFPFPLLPSFLRKPYKAILRPFQPFIFLEEIPTALQPGGQPESRTLRIFPTWRYAFWLLFNVCELSLWSYVTVSASLEAHEIQVLALLQALIWAYSLFRLVRKKPSTPPYSLAIIYVFLLLESFFNLQSFLLTFTYHLDDFKLSHALIISDTLLIFFQLIILTSLPLQPYAPPPRKEGERPLSPDDYVTLFQWLAFTWVNSLISVAQTKTIGKSDVWQLSPFFSSRISFQNFHQKFPGKVLLWRVVRANSLDVVISLCFYLISTMLLYVQPLMMNRILVAISNSDGKGEGFKAVRFAFYALFATMLKAETDLVNLWHARRGNMRARTMIQTSVYYKTLLKKDRSGFVDSSKEDEKSTAKGKAGEGTKEKKKVNADVGRIINLMSSDAERVSGSQLMLPILYIAPLEVIVATTLLYKLIGWSCFAGLIVVPFASFATKIIGGRNRKLMEALNTIKDKRLTATNELIQLIRQIKWFGWETQWAGKVLDIRNKELQTMVKYWINTIILSLVWEIAPAAIAYLTFFSYIKLAKQTLDVATAFTALSLLNMVQDPLFRVSQGVVYAITLVTSVKRVQEYLEEEEVPDWVSAYKAQAERLNVKIEKIGFENASFQYSTAHDNRKIENSEEEESHTFMLRDLNVEFPIGKLSLVTGATGSGKSSLILALLGEIDCVEGSVFLPKQPLIVDENGHYNSVALAMQTPWLQHATIKENILFNSPYDEERYNDVLQACALVPDLAMLEDGDSTEIGEKGVSLSGGQKARVALARAFYSRAQHVILDDPLSAVDTHTAEHIVSHFSTPLLKNRTIILVTHHLDLCLPVASYLIQMSEGRILSQEAVEPEEKLVPIVNDDEKHHPEFENPEPEPEVTIAVESSSSPLAAPLEIASAPTPPKKAPRRLVEEEAKADGSVKLRIYIAYLSAAGWGQWLLLSAAVVGDRVIAILDQLFLKFWSEGYNTAVAEGFAVLATSRSTYHFLEHYLSDSHHSYSSLNFQSSSNDSMFQTQGLKDLPSPIESPDTYLLLYLGLKLIAVGAGMLSTIVAMFATLKAARKLFAIALMKVVRSPMRYFDTTQTGRLLSRFSKDFDTIDSKLSNSVRTSFYYLSSYIFSIALIFFVVPPFMVVAVIIGFLYLRLSQSYLRCSREIRRLESNSRSPIYSQFGETLAGVITIRGFSSEVGFMESLYDQVDQFQANHYALWMANRYLLWRFDLLGACTIFFTSTFALAGGISAGWAALGISSAISLSRATYWVLRMYGELELDLNSVERVDELCILTEEPPTIIEGHRPPAYWPSDKGSLVVENLTMKYAPDLDPVLKKISFTVAPKEKIGVVGRTGSGKSTLALSLLRFTDPSEGKIILDGIDITSIGVQDLRTKITLIPQEPALFTGTIRSNLDPFSEHTDAECWEALARVHLVSSGNNTGSSTPTSTMSTSSATLQDSLESSSTFVAIASKRLDVKSLDDPVSQGGLNLSAGQRQLMSLARALLRNTNVILMDEATASVDQETDRKIQSTIQAEFAESMVLTIAHRLRTIITYDKILVLDHGEVAEFDSPANLIAKEGGVFYEMCKKSADWELLKGVLTK